MDEQPAESGAPAPPVSSTGARHWPGWVGAGLAGAGLACAAWALRSPVAPSRAAMPGAVLAGVLLACLALAAVAVCAVRRVPHRIPAVAGMVAAGAAAVVTAQAAKVDLDGGLPRMAVPLAAGALLLLTLGQGLLALAPARRGHDGEDDRLRGRRVPRVASLGVAALVALGATAVAVAGAWTLEHRLAVDATTAPPPGDRPPAARPKRVAWTWEQSGDAKGLAVPFQVGKPGDVVPAGAGLAVADGDGVVALDGPTGEERWHFRLPGAVLETMIGSPSGTWVVAQFHSGTRESDDNARRIVAFDGATGEVAWDLVAEASTDEPRSDAFGILVDPTFGVNLFAMSDNTLVALDQGDERALIAFDMASGEETWSWRPPDEDDCGWDLSVDGVAVGRDTVLVRGYCTPSAGDGGVTDGYVLVALDDRTGAERWRLERPDQDLPFFGFVPPEIAPGGGVALVELLGEVVIDTATGETVLPAVDRPRSNIRTETVGETWLATTDPTDAGAAFDLVEPGGLVATVTVPGCGYVHQAFASVEDALVVVCSGAEVQTPVDQQEPAVHVVPWDAPDGARVVDLDVGPVVSPRTTADVPRLVITPDVIAVMHDGGTRITALGP